MGRQPEHQTEAEFRAWVMASRVRLRTTAFLICGDWFLADDLVQDALARLYAVWPRVVQRGDPQAYVRRIVVNLHLDHRRRPARREVLTPDELDGERPEEPSQDEYRDQLIAALRQVPPPQRAVLVLRYWEDLSVEQTAAVLGTSTGTVKSQASRGLDALRAQLGGSLQGTPREAP